MMSYATKGALASVLLAVALAGCGADRARDLTPTEPEDYQQRHQIVIGAVQETYSVIPAGRDGKLSAEQRRNVANFVEGYRRQGRGPLSIQTANDSYAANVDVAHVVSAGGVPTRSVLREYGPSTHLVLKYSRTAPKLDHACGEWPDQLAPASIPKIGESGTPWLANRSYHNYGCATQQAFAAQVADPNDLLGPAPEAAIDGARRSTVYQQYRSGRDPSTQYRTSEPKQTAR